ncbi:unnamed protein product [Urochloa humidicola]
MVVLSGLRASGAVSAEVGGSEIRRGAARVHRAEAGDMARQRAATMSWHAESGVAEDATRPSHPPSAIVEYTLYLKWMQGVLVDSVKKSKSGALEPFHQKGGKMQERRLLFWCSFFLLFLLSFLTQSRGKC